MTLRKNQPKMNVKSWSFSTTGMGRVILPASQLASTHSSIASSSMQGASSTGAASEAAASAIRTRGANCAGLASAGRTESAEGPRARVYAEAEPAKSSESVVVRSMVGEWAHRRNCYLDHVGEASATFDCLDWHSYIVVLRRERELSGDLKGKGWWVVVRKILGRKGLKV